MPRILIPVIFCMLVSLAAPLEASSPGLSGIRPAGARRGAETELLLVGARLTDAVDVLFYGEGVSLVKLEVVNDNQVKATVKIAADARLGERALRVRAKSGLSELRTFFVGALAVVEEVEPNNDFQKPQKVALETTIAGVAKNEDVDYYSFEAKKGQRVTAEVEGMRLANSVFDPYVAILNSARFEIAACDDSPLLGQDPVASAVIPEDGTYVVEVRESAYAGNDGCLYRMHLGTFPRPLALFPAGGKAGDEVEVLFLGDVGGEIKEKIKLPAAPDPDFGIFAQGPGGIAPSANPFRVCAAANAFETEPNENKDQATKIEIDQALNGVISPPGDVDFYRFSAKKGQVYDFNVYARRIHTGLDPILTIKKIDGTTIVTNDDAVGPDSYLRFTVPEDADYLIRVKDHLGRGGPCDVYRVEATAVAPRVTLSIPKVQPYSQERQAISVPRGNRAATLLSVGRADFGGEVTIAAEGLPAGISLSAENVAASVDAVPVVFEAAADASPAASLAPLFARPVDAAQKVTSGFAQMTELVIGSPGQSVYTKYDAERLAIAVTEEVPFKITIVEPKVPLVRNGSMALKVVAERKEGFKAPIALLVVWNPPGVGSSGGVSIAEGQNEASIPLNANGGAPVRAWKIAVIGNAAVGNGPSWVSTPLATLRIAEPAIALKMDRAAVEQGKETEVVCKVERADAFEGSAKLKLFGLPPKVTATDLEMQKDTKELAFKLTAEAGAPAGKHKNIFCQVVQMENGEPVVYSSGSTELRIDPPLPPKPDQPPAAAAAPPPEKKPEAAKPPEKPPEKRLTRLEKLRLEAEEKAKAAKKEGKP